MSILKDTFAIAAASYGVPFNGGPTVQKDAFAGNEIKQDLGIQVSNTPQLTQ